MTDDTFHPADPAMLDLFRIEAGNQAAVLESGLSSLEEGPVRPEQLEPLGKAAGSIKGVAALVGLDSAAALAQSLEKVFQAGRTGFDSAGIGACRQAVDLFTRVSRANPEDIPGFLSETASEMNTLLETLESIAEAGPEPEILPEASEPKPPAGTQKEPAPLPVDPSMLDMFRMETEIHVATLLSGLSTLESGEPGRTEDLIRAAHSLRGAARIVGLAGAASLAQAMESLFEAHAIGKAGIDRAGLDICRRAVDLFQSLSVLEPEKIPDFLAEQEGPLAGIQADLAAMAQTEKKTSPLPPKKPAPSHLADASMLDLFQIEAASHSAALESGLLNLEGKTGDASKIEPLMRAAHSIKGAARIVGLDPAVSLAHVMEDLFVAGQRGELVIDSVVVDVCLKAVDFLKNLSEMPPDDIPGYLSEYVKEIGEIERELDALLKGEAGAGDRIPETIPPAPRVPGPAPRETPAETTDDRAAPAPPGQKESAILVSADRLSRLMGLAGECLVQGRSLEHFSRNLGDLKRSLQRVSDGLNSLSEFVDEADAEPEIVSKLGTVRERTSDCWDTLIDHLDSFESFWLGWENLVERLFNEAVATRMRPFRDGTKGFPRLVRDAARKLNKKIKLVIEGDNTRVDRDILAKLEAPLNHIIRNACDHGIATPRERLSAGKPEEGVIRIEAGHRAGLLLVSVSDDGQGINPESIREKVIEKGLATAGVAAGMSTAELMEFLFVPGFSTARSVTEISGRGVGLDVVQNMVQEVGGAVRVKSEPGLGTSFFLQLPLTRSVIRTLIVEIKGEPYAVPLTRIDRVLAISLDEVESVEDRMYYHYEGHNIGLMPARQPFGLPLDPGGGEELQLVIVSDRLSRYGLVVDRLLGERDLVVRPLDPILEKVPNISAGSILENGDPVLIVDVDDLVRSIDNILGRTRPARIGDVDTPAETVRAKQILVVDDSITVREVERKLLENYGYDVDVAVDGMDGWNAVRTRKYDLLISDVDMPRMNGLELVESVKQDTKLRDLPVIIVSYKDREEDRLRGLQVGADYYLTKGSFYDETFIQAVVDLIGEP